MPTHNTPILSLRNASLTIPVYSSASRSLKLRFSTILNRTKIPTITTINALKNLNIDFFSGQRIALLGRNGSGKTSFLRLVSNVYQVTSGELISSINLVPMINKAFPTSLELSGSIALKAYYLYVYKSLDGFDDFYSQVVAFSGVGRFIDLPIKTYSEGMSQRLLFSMLTQSHHEGLAIDESFGTGDIEFQRKSEKRLSEFLSSPKLLFMASHSNEMLSQFCTEGLVFDSGTIVFSGTLNESIKYYEGLCSNE